ncbi:MAG TPA: hypothetical protein DCR87_03920 [Acidobacteria bacterium]|nr:hypothetical protein [Acidobacteriota bacterium]
MNLIRHPQQKPVIPGPFYRPAGGIPGQLRELSLAVIKVQFSKLFRKSSVTGKALALLQVLKTW